MRAKTYIKRFARLHTEPFPIILKNNKGILYDFQFYKGNYYNSCWIIILCTKFFRSAKQSSFIINLELIMHIDVLMTKLISTDKKAGNMIANQADTTQ